MEPSIFVEIMKKYGVTGLLTVMFALMFNFFSARLEKVEAKLEKVEAKLYECLEDRIQSSSLDKKIDYNNFLVAILPKKETYGIEREMEC